MNFKNYDASNTVEKLLMQQDGSMTRNLQILTDGPINTTLISESTDFEKAYLNDHIDIKEPLIIRKVILKSHEHSLIFAISYWNETDYHNTMK